MARLPRNVTRRGDVYYSDFVVNGKRIRKSLGRDLQEARRAAGLERNRLLSTRGDQIEAQVTLGSFSKRWMDEYVQQSRKQKGVDLAGQRLRDFVSPVLGAIRLVDLAVPHIRALRGFVEAQGLKPLSVRHVLSDARCLLFYAQECGLIKQVPSFRGIMPTEPAILPRRLTDEQVTAVLAATPDSYQLAVRLALLTGLRWGEIRDLQWCHVQMIPRPCLRLERTKSGKLRTVPLVTEAVELLRKAQEGSQSPYVLPRRPQHAGGFVDRIERQTEISWHFHMLRHTFASRWREQGRSMSALQVILGHSTIRLTERYAEMSDDAVFAAAGEFSTEFRSDPVTVCVTPSLQGNG